MGRLVGTAMKNKPPDLTGEIAQKTFKYLIENRMSLNPFNYRIWFEYFTGTLSEVKTTLDRIIQSGEKIDEKKARELYAEFFERDLNREEQEKFFREMNMAEEINRKAGELFLRLIKELFDSTEKYSKYGLSLERFKKEIGSGQGVEGVREFLCGLLNETVRIQESNQKLLHDLDDSSKKLADLTTQLEEAKMEAQLDKLTQLYNRRAFERHIREEVERFSRYLNPFSVLMMDIDNFKNLNDTYGHQVGDRALVSISQTLSACVRKSDLVYRFGGEEFCVILPGTGLKSAKFVGEKIRSSVQETEFTVKDQTVEITLSGGVSETVKGDTVEELILRADKALYLAKREGKNRVKTQLDLDGGAR